MGDSAHASVLSVLQVRPRSRAERLALAATFKWGHGKFHEVYARQTVGTATTAIVFVHGFGGHPTLTWTRFPDLLAAEPDLAECDLIFYGYDSLGDQLGDMASHLMDFLHDLAERPHEMLNRGRDFPDHRPDTFRYQSILIVAHSLGALVTRRALLDAQGNKETWVARTQFMLFAPADRGADAVSLVSETLVGIPFGSIASGVLKHLFPILVSLEPEGGDIADLLKHTDELTLGGRASFLKAQRVSNASNERVTKKKKFLSDEFNEDIPRTTHVTVCKPVAGRLDAIAHVLATYRRMKQ